MFVFKDNYILGTRLKFHSNSLLYDAKIYSDSKKKIKLLFEERFKLGVFQFQQVLKRASSVPTRVPEIIPILSRHEKTQSQQDSIEVQTTVAPTLTPSTTEESVTAVGPSMPGSGTSREPLMYNYSSSSNPATGSSQTPDDDYKPNTSQSLSKLPGVIPVSGHNGPTGWL